MTPIVKLRTLFVFCAPGFAKVHVVFGYYLHKVNLATRRALQTFTACLMIEYIRIGGVFDQFILYSLFKIYLLNL